MAWRMVNAKGTTEVVSEFVVNKLLIKYGHIYEVCERHRVLCSGKKAYNSHVQKEHAY